MPPSMTSHPPTSAYLLKYDTVYGRYEGDVRHENSDLIIDGNRYRVLSEKDPANLPWGDMGIDLVFECTGAFTRKPDLEKHIQAGAKRVILSAPAKGDGIQPSSTELITPMETA